MAKLLIIIRIRTLTRAEISEATNLDLYGNKGVIIVKIHLTPEVGDLARISFR